MRYGARATRMFSRYGFWILIIALVLQLKSQVLALIAVAVFSVVLLILATRYPGSQQSDSEGRARAIR